MTKTPKILNKFNRAHAGLRKFLRLVSYGCYHRNLFGRHKITPRSYDDLIRQLRFFIPKENIQITWRNKCAYFTFVGDFRHGTKNYFYSSFLLKTLLPEHCLYKIILLQVLGEKPLTFSEILERGEEIILKYKPEVLSGDADFLQLLRRRLNELIDSGIVRRVEVGNKIFFEKIPNPFGELSAAEKEILHSALKFFRNVSLIGTAGYFLCDSLRNFYGVSEPAREIFQFRNNNFARILDDDILFTITKALRQRKKILIECENKLPAIVTPVAVETDFLYNRQYLVALKKKELVRLRVEKILNVSLAKEEAKNFSSTNEKLREVRLSVKFENPDEKSRREKLLTDAFPARIIEETAGEFICVVAVNDPLQIYPHLWRFQTWAEILPGADDLRERMKKDAEEALENYAKPL